MSGKGSKRRPEDRAKVAANWDRINWRNDREADADRHIFERGGLEEATREGGHGESGEL